MERESQGSGVAGPASEGGMEMEGWREERGGGGGIEEGDGGEDGGMDKGRRDREGFRGTDG